MKQFLWFILLIASIANADYYGSHPIDAFLTIQETLHDSAGDKVAATGDVDLWVYEDDNDVQILDLTMDAFDSVTGVYEQKFQLTVAAGFEAGKTYTVLIQATADGASGTNTHTFQILASVNVEKIEDGDATDVLNAATPDLSAITGDKDSYKADVSGIETTLGTNGDGLTSINLPDQTMNITGNLSGSVGSVTADVTTDSASRTASQATSVNLEDNAITEAKITDAAWQELIELMFTYDATGSYGDTSGSIVDEIVDNAASQTWDETPRVLTASTNFNDLSAAQVNAEVDTALDTAIPGSPTKDSINDRIKTGIIDIIESQRERHTAQGTIFYVDPVNGATHGSGARGGRADPYLTIQDCHDNAVTAWAHDVIILIAGDTDSVTTHSIAGTTTISKAYTFIRGPGRDFIITRTGAGDTISITGDGVQISGVQIGTAGTGSGDGIDITDADFTRIRYCWFLDTQGDGIHILRGTNGRYHHNHFDGTGVGGTGQGMHIVGTSGSSNDNAIFYNHFADTGGDSILIEQGITNDTSIHHNKIHNAGGWAINIGGSSTDALVHDNFFGNNSSGDVNDGGITTVEINNDQWATVDGVWDELLIGSTHNIPTSAGRIVRESGANIIISGTSPDTGGTANTAIRIELDNDASSMDGAYDPANVCIIKGTGEGQSRQVWEYDGGNKYAYINRDWKIIPDDTSEYIITGSTGNTHVNEGLARGGGASTITFNTLASDIPNAYRGQIVFIAAGVGQDQRGIIASYDETTKIATMEQPWETEPTSGSIYAVIPFGIQLLADIMDTMFSYDATGAYGDEAGSVVDQIVDNAGGGGGGDATEAKQDTIIASVSDGKGIGFVEGTHSQVSILERGNVAWLTGAGSTPSDMYTDITTVPWQQVYHEIGNTSNEYYRDNLYTANGTPIISDRLKIGKRVRE